MIIIITVILDRPKQFPCLIVLAYLLSRRHEGRLICLVHLSKTQSETLSATKLIFFRGLLEIVNQITVRIFYRVCDMNSVEICRAYAHILVDVLQLMTFLSSIGYIPYCHRAANPLMIQSACTHHTFWTFSSKRGGTDFKGISRHFLFSDMRFWSKSGECFRSV